MIPIKYFDVSLSFTDQNDTVGTRSAHSAFLGSEKGAPSGRGHNAECRKFRSRLGKTVGSKIVDPAEKIDVKISDFFTVFLARAS